MGSTVISRRAAVRGAVWSIPAVTVATTAPAFAQRVGAAHGHRLRRDVRPRPTGAGHPLGDRHRLRRELSADRHGAGRCLRQRRARRPPQCRPTPELTASHTLVFTSTTSDFHATLDLGSRTELAVARLPGPGVHHLRCSQASGGRQSELDDDLRRGVRHAERARSTTTPTRRPASSASSPTASLPTTDYPGVIGRIVLVVAIPKVAGAAKPATAAQSTALGRAARGSPTRPTWLYRFTTTQSHHTSRTGPQAGNADRGPAPHAAGGRYYEFWADMDGMPADLVDAAPLCSTSRSRETPRPGSRSLEPSRPDRGSTRRPLSGAAARRRWCPRRGCSPATPRRRGPRRCCARS